MIQLILLAVTFGVSTATKPNQAMMILKSKGYVAKHSLPSCNSGKKIHLLSYQYQNSSKGPQCSSSLSPAAKLLMHEKCSLKKTCDDLKFPQEDFQLNNWTRINVTYQCLDQYTAFVDICANTTKSGYEPVHLLYRNNKNYSAKYETCSCHITGDGGSFSVLVSDVRLKSATDPTCTRSQLHANYETYTCNETRDDYGSVFMQTEKADRNAGYVVKFEPRHSSTEPEMIYLTTKHEGTVSLTCKNRPRTATSFKPSDFNETSSKDEGSTSSMAATIAGVCGCAVALILVSGAVFMKYRSRNWKYNLERLVERHLQLPREASPAQCIDDDDYVELKHKSRAPESIKCNGAGFAEPPDSYYDPVNNRKPVMSTVHTLQATKDSNIYSYAEHQPEKRMIAAASPSRSSNPDDRKFPRVDGISDGDNAISKHVYVKLLPVQETEAGECCDSVQSDAGMEMKDLSNNNQSDAPHLKRTGFFNGSEVNENTSSYSFAKEPYQARYLQDGLKRRLYGSNTSRGAKRQRLYLKDYYNREAGTTPLFDSQSPEEPMTHSGQNQYDTTTATKMKAIPCHNYDHAKKRDNSETSCASDDEHYDRVDGDRTPVQINPNYDKLLK